MKLGKILLQVVFVGLCALVNWLAITLVGGRLEQIGPVFYYFVRPLLLFFALTFVFWAVFKDNKRGLKVGIGATLFGLVASYWETLFFYFAYWVDPP